MCSAELQQFEGTMLCSFAEAGRTVVAALREL